MHIWFRILSFCLFSLLSFVSAAQKLQPGFDKAEYLRLMYISAQFGDSAYGATLRPVAAKMLYRSPVTGFDNCWELWKDSTGAIVISIRGTTPQQLSWLANLYAAMVPATGTMILSPKDTFRYALAADSNAAVHVGWLAATGFMAKDVLEKLHACIDTGHKNFLIMGHSQGGAIAYLLTAYLRSLQEQGKLPTFVQFKTYCSAAPKPGNLYFAYDYESKTQSGWSFNVVNSLDWVPQTPFTVQTLQDMPDINPFQDAGKIIKKQKWPGRWAFRYAYGRLTKPSRKALKNYQKFLGDYAGKAARKQLPGLMAPAYANSNDYVRTGVTIVLQADEAYKKKFPQDKRKVFANHFHQQYVYLAKQLP